MGFRFWLEEITRIHLEDTVREGGLEALDMQHMFQFKTDKKQGKEVEVKNTQLDREASDPFIHLREPAFFR